MTTQEPETDVPIGETPKTSCPYCDRPFRNEHLLSLHIGQSHWDESTEDEREAYEEAYESETDELFVFHLKVIVGLTMLYFTFALTYALVLSG